MNGTKYGFPHRGDFSTPHSYPHLRGIRWKIAVAFKGPRWKRNVARKEVKYERERWKNKVCLLTKWRKILHYIVGMNCSKIGVGLPACFMLTKLEFHCFLALAGAGRQEIGVSKVWTLLPSFPVPSYIFYCARFISNLLREQVSVTDGSCRIRRS